MQLETGKAQHGLVGTFKMIIKEEGYTAHCHTGRTKVYTDFFSTRPGLGGFTKVMLVMNLPNTTSIIFIIRPCPAFANGGT